MSNLKEVAKRAGVSTMTASNVLRGTVPVSDALTKRVHRALRELDYHPNHLARSLKAQHTRTLGMVIPDITISFFPRIVQGAEHTARAHGYTIFTINTEEDAARESQALSLLRSHRVDGILLVVASETKSFVHIENARRAKIPVVCLDRVPAALDIDSVCSDSVDGAQRCVGQLIASGHRRIAALTGLQTLDNERERLRGYRRALRAAKLPVLPELVWEANFSPEQASQVCQDRLERARPRPTAVFATNGIAAIGCLEAFFRLGLRCPEDVALATFDQLTSIHLLRPRITSVLQPAHDIGSRGADLLIRRLKGQVEDTGAVRILLPTELQLGDSSQKI